MKRIHIRVGGLTCGAIITIFITIAAVINDRGKMASIIESDGSGRVVIPKKVRQELDITPKTQFILTSNKKGQIMLQKLDLEEISKRLEEELADTPVLELAQEIRDAINEKVRQAHSIVA